MLGRTKKRIVGKIIWGPRRSHIKENGAVSKTSVGEIESDAALVNPLPTEWNNSADVCCCEQI